MRLALLELLNELDDISKKHREIHDTPVRETLQMTIFDGIGKNPGDEFDVPTNYHMYTDKANKLIYAAVMKFLSDAEVHKAFQGLTTDEERISALVNLSVVSEEGNEIGDYIGYP